VVHIDAGMRCGDLSVPEEVNRVLISRVAAVHLTPTEHALENLEDEGIEPERIHFVGSLMAESVLAHTDAIRRFRTCSQLGLTERGYVLGSFHLPENLCAEDRLRGILEGLAQSALPVLVPDANGLRDAMASFGLSARGAVHVIDPVQYLEMLSLQRDAAAVVTDSGGVQVESCMLCVPCITVRQCTEFGPTVENGANRLVDATAVSIRGAVAEATGRRASWTAPKRWDRGVSDRITRILKRGIEPLS
jgi:UDP-N-acetylglucosamine 2-epimerase